MDETEPFSIGTPSRVDPIERRVFDIKKPRWVEYPRAKTALQLLKDLMEHPKTHRMPCLLVHGKSGMGKTMIVDKFVRSIPAGYDKENGNCVYRVVRIECPPTPDEADFYLTILSAIAAPAARHLRASSIRDEAIRLLKDVGCDLLIIDEIHNILSGSARQQHILLNCLRHLTNEAQVPIACFGIDSALRAIAHDDQLANRFESFALPAWKLGPDLRSLVIALMRSYGMSAPESAAEDECLREVIIQTDGVLGRIVRLLQNAAVTAVRDGSNSVTLATLLKQRESPPLISMLLSHK